MAIWGTPRQRGLRRQRDVGRWHGGRPVLFTMIQPVAANVSYVGSPATHTGPQGQAGALARQRGDVNGHPGQVATATGPRPKSRCLSRPVATGRRCASPEGSEPIVRNTVAGSRIQASPADPAAAASAAARAATARSGQWSGQPRPPSPRAPAPAPVRTVQFRSHAKAHPGTARGTGAWATTSARTGSCTTATASPTPPSTPATAPPPTPTTCGSWRQVSQPPPGSKLKSGCCGFARRQLLLCAVQL